MVIENSAIISAGRSAITVGRGGGTRTLTATGAGSQFSISGINPSCG